VFGFGLVAPGEAVIAPDIFWSRWNHWTSALLPDASATTAETCETFRRGGLSEIEEENADH